MNIGIVTVAHSGYGKYLVQWCQSIAAVTPAPTVVTVVLGREHGATIEDIDKSRDLIPDINIIKKPREVILGRMRNIVVKQTVTEWISVVDIDDFLFPWAIEEYEKHEANADVLLIRWIERDYNGNDTEKAQRTPLEIAKSKQRGRGFVHNGIPFRRSFWEKKPFPESNYPGMIFAAQLAEAKARFVKLQRPTTLYVRHRDSFCATVKYTSELRKEVRLLAFKVGHRLRNLYRDEL